MEKIPDLVKNVLEKRWIQELLIVLFLIYLSILDDGFDLSQSHPVRNSFFLILLVYLQAQTYRFYIFPRFLRSGNWPLHLAFSSLLIIFFSGISFSIDLFSHRIGWYDDFPDDHFVLFIFYLIVYIISSAIIFLVLTALQFYSEKKKARDYELQLHQMELSHLRNQFKPHFLFNTLNNLYGISLQEPHRVSDMILKLSKIMRYQLENIQKEWVRVEETLDFFNAYVSVERERVAPRCKVSFEINVQDLSLLKKQISPMVLFNFVDNAFKYGTADAEESLIRIHIEASRGELILSVQNTIPKSTTIVPSTGTGLQSAKDLLQLLYPGKHQLMISQKEGIFYVSCLVQL